MSTAEAAALASPAKSVEAGGGGGSEAPDADLPKALLKRILKARLSQLDVAAGGDGKRDFQINKVRGSGAGERHTGGGGRRRRQAWAAPQPPAGRPPGSPLAPLL